MCSLVIIFVGTQTDFCSFNIEFLCLCQIQNSLSSYFSLFLWLLNFMELYVLFYFFWNEMLWHCRGFCLLTNTKFFVPNSQQLYSYNLCLDVFYIIIACSVFFRSLFWENIQWLYHVSKDVSILMQEEVCKQQLNATHIVTCVVFQLQWTINRQKKECFVRCGNKIGNARLQFINVPKMEQLAPNFDVLGASACYGLKFAPNSVS